MTNKKGTVTISLEQYKKLLKIKKALNDDKIYLTTRSGVSKIISKDKYVKDLIREIEHLNNKLEHICIKLKEVSILKFIKYKYEYDFHLNWIDL